MNRQPPLAPAHAPGASPTTLAGLLACGLLPSIGLFAPGLVLPAMARHFAASPQAPLLTELVGTLASFAFALGAPLAGRLVARRGGRAVILPGLVLFALCGTLPALLDDLWLILAARAALGLALAGIFTGALSGIASLPESQRARMFGGFSMAGSAAAIALFPIVGLLGHASWRLAFLVHLVALPVLLLAIALPPALGRAAPAAARHGPELPLNAPLLNAPLLRLLAVAAIVGMGMLVGPICAPLYLAGLGVSDTRVLAIPATLGSIASVFASASYGWLHPRIGPGGITLLALLVSTAALAIAGSSGDVLVFCAMVVVQSATVALMAPNISATALACSPPDRSGEAMGLANGMMFGAQLAFPFLAALVRAHGGIGAVFLILAALAGAAAMMNLYGARAPRPAGAAQ
ncbi:MAG TPA: MFS transporter [Novosphingobium sp.]|nr:MFS transporter [Novosphingobium sp.]